MQAAGIPQDATPAAIAVHFPAISKMMGWGFVVSKVARHRLIGLLAVLIVAVAVVPAASGQTQPTPSFSHMASRLAQAANMTLQKGAHSKLPPHISTLLGLTKEQEAPIMQGVLRNGKLVQGIDVSVANNKNIILFVVDEATGDQHFYLTAPEGNLRKVVSIKDGIGTAAHITEEEQTAFKKEKQFWIDHLAPTAPAK
jgi:hypothetical protein